jgi:hypothetical protein
VDVGKPLATGCNKGVSLDRRRYVNGKIRAYQVGPGGSCSPRHRLQ